MQYDRTSGAEELYHYESSLWTLIESEWLNSDPARFTTAKRDFII